MIEVRKKDLYILGTCLYLAFCIFILIALCETWARFRTHQNTKHHPYCHDENLGYRLCPNKRTANFNGIEVFTDDLGMRTSHASRTNEKALRILALGDSVIFGFAQPYENTVLSIMEKKWKEAHPTKPIQIHNAGVPGYTLEQWVGWYGLYGQKVKPDLVLLFVNPNDILPPFFLDAGGQQDNMQNRNWFRKNSAAYSFLYKSLSDRHLIAPVLNHDEVLQSLYVGDIDQHPFLRERFNEIGFALRIFKRQLDQDRVPVIAVMIVRRPEAEQTLPFRNVHYYTSIFAALGIPTWYPLQDFQAPNARSYFIDFGHYSASGHEKMAQALLPKLSQVIFDLKPFGR